VLARRARVWLPPADTSAAPLSPDTVTGTLAFVVELFPNCPELFRPQHLTTPDDNRAHV
jgi:hypothetical protein